MVFCSKERALILESMSHSKVMHNTGNKADLLKSIILSIICPSKIWSKKIIAACFLCNLFRKYFIYKQKLAVPGQLGYELKRKPFFFNVLLAHRKCFSFHCEWGLPLPYYTGVSFHNSSLFFARTFFAPANFLFKPKSYRTDTGDNHGLSRYSYYQSNRYNTNPKMGYLTSSLGYPADNQNTFIRWNTDLFGLQPHSQPRILYFFTT